MSARPAAPPAAAPALSRPAGVACFLAALACNAVFDAGSKALLAYYPAPFLNIMRYGTISAIGLFLLLRHGWPRWRDVPHKPLLLARGLVLGLVGTCFMTALIWMPLSEATAIYFTSPLIMVGLSPWLLRERVGRAQWLAVLAGFAGMLLIVRPGGSLPALGTALMAVAAVCYALFQVFTRKLAGRVDAPTQYASTAFVCLLMTGLPAPFFLPREWPPAADLLGILALDACNGAAQVLFIAAFRRVDATTLAPLNYIHLLLAVLLSTVVLNRPPDAVAMGGMALITLAGVFLLRRPAPPPPPQ